MALQTRNVFVDTQSFVKAGLEFQSRTIQAFAHECGSGELKHITTTVVVREVHDKIKDHIREALNKVQDFRRKAKILEGSTDPVIAGLFARFDAAQIEAQAQEVFKSFMSDADTVIVNLKQVDADEVFRRYFEHEAPFQEGKKKSEFPDAFSLLAVEAHLGEGEECYVVSEDDDLKTFCEANRRFVWIETLSKLLDIYNSHNSERSDFIKKYLEDHTEVIKNAIANQVDEADFNNDSTWEDAEVVDHEVLSVDDFEADIIHIDDEQCVVSFEANVHYKVQVEGPDFVNGTYDKESGRVFTFDNTVREELEELEVKVEIELDYEVRDGKFNVSDMRVLVLNLSSGVEVSVEETPWDDPR